MNTEPIPTESEIAAAKEIYQSRLKSLIRSCDAAPHIIAKYNAPLHAQVAEAVIAMRAISDASIKQAKDHAKIIADQHAKLAAQKRENEIQENALGDTIDARNKREDQIQSLHVALGGDGEWSNEQDLGVESNEMIEALKSKLVKQKAALELAFKTLNFCTPFEPTDPVEWQCKFCNSYTATHKDACKFVLALAAIKEALQ